MRLVIMASIVCLGLRVLLDQAGAGPAEAQLSEAELRRRAEVMRRHEKELRQRPDVLGLLASEKEIIIETDRPESLPKEIEGVPVKIVPPPPVLPPPPGVIVLRSGGVREHLEKEDSCPPGFRDDIRYRWHFCVDPEHPEPLPTGMMTPPIAGIPYEEAKKIVERNADMLEKLPGVRAVMLGEDGITVETDQPEFVPQSVEGLPVKAVPPGEYQELNHTFNSPLVNPLHGSILVGHFFSGNRTTSSGVVISQGKPWMIASAHLLTGRCASQPNCVTCDPPNPCFPPAPAKLNQCPHSSSNSQDLIVGTPGGPTFPLLGFASRWTQTAANSPDSDNMALFLDNDTTEGNGSLRVDRKLESYPFTFSGREEEPMLNQPVTIVGGTSHRYYGTVVNTFISQTTVPASCLGAGSSHHVTNQFRFRASPGSEDVTLVGGNSGAPVLNGLGRIVGIDNWGERTFFPPATYGGGTLASKIRSVQGFDAWYGTDTVPDQTIGIFRPSVAWWSIDNGNGKWDNACAATPSCDYSNPNNVVCYEGCFFYGTAGSINGVPRSIPLTGDWNGDGTITVGIYRTDINPKRFELSNTLPTGQGAPITLNTSGLDWQPVVGKWAGISGAVSKTKMGVFQSSTGNWYLDAGDCNVATTCVITDPCSSPDTCFNTASWTLLGDKPLAGDWNGDGIVTIGVFRPSNSTYYLNNPLPPSGANVVINAGNPIDGFRPVVADWIGTGGTKLGVYKPSTGGWWLVSQLGNPVNCTTDHCVGPFGNPEDLPVAFGKSVIRAN